MPEVWSQWIAASAREGQRVRRVSTWADINRVQWSSCLDSSPVQFCSPRFKRLASRLHVEEVRIEVA